MSAYSLGSAGSALPVSTGGGGGATAGWTDAHVLHACRARHVGQAAVRLISKPAGNSTALRCRVRPWHPLTRHCAGRRIAAVRRAQPPWLPCPISPLLPSPPRRLPRHTLLPGARGDLARLQPLSLLVPPPRQRCRVAVRAVSQACVTEAACAAALCRQGSSSGGREQRRGERRGAGQAARGEEGAGCAAGGAEGGAAFCQEEAAARRRGAARLTEDEREQRLRVTEGKKREQLVQPERERQEWRQSKRQKEMCDARRASMAPG